MSEQQIPIDPELSEIEAALGLLTPSRNRLDRDRLMFESGQAMPRRASPGRWVWPASTASLALISLGMAGALVSRPEPRVIERLVYVRESPPEHDPVVILRQEPTPPATTPPVPRSFESYERLDRRLLRFGAEGLPEPPLLLSTEFTALDVTSEKSGSLLRSEIAKLLKPGEPL